MLDNKIKKSKKKLLTLGVVSLGGIILLTAATTMLVPQSLSQNLSTIANFNEYYSVSKSEIATLKALISQNNTLTNPQKEALETNIDKILNGSNHSDNPNTNITSPLSIDVDKSLEYNTKYEYKLNYNKQLSNQVNLWPLLNKEVVKDLIKNVYYNKQQLDINDFRLTLINQLNDDESNLKEILKQDTNNLYIREIRLMLLKNNPIDKRIKIISKLSEYNIAEYDKFLEEYLSKFNINDYMNRNNNNNNKLREIYKNNNPITLTEWNDYKLQFTKFKFSIPFLEIKQFKLHIPNNPQLNKASDGNYHSEAFLNIPVNLILTYDENSKEFQYKQNDNPIISVSLSDDSLKSLSGLKNHYDLKDYEKALSHNVNINYPQYDPNGNKNQWLKIKSSNSDIASLVKENYNNKVIVNNNSANLLNVNINWSNENNNVIKDINIDTLKNEFYIVNIVKWQDKYGKDINENDLGSQEYTNNRKLITATYDNNRKYITNRSETFAVVSKEILDKIQGKHKLFYNYVYRLGGDTKNPHYIESYDIRNSQKNTEFQNAYFNDSSMTLEKWAKISNIATNSNKWNLNQIFDLNELDFAKKVMFNSNSTPVDNFNKSYNDGVYGFGINNYNYFDQYSNRKYIESLQFTNTYPGFSETPRNNNYLWAIKEVKALTSESILKIMNENTRFNDYVSNIITNNNSASNNNANSNLSTDLINKILSDDYLITNMVFSSKNKTSLNETDFNKIDYFSVDNNINQFKLLPFWKSKSDLENNFFKRIENYITNLSVDEETKIKYRKKLSQIRSIVISKGNVIDNNEYIYQVLLPKDAVLPINIINNIRMSDQRVNENVNNNDFRFNRWSDVPQYLQNWILSVANFLRTLYLTNLVTISKNNHSITELRWGDSVFKTRNGNIINKADTDNYGEVVRKLRNQHNSPIKYFKGIWNFMINDTAFPIEGSSANQSWDNYYGLMYNGYNRETQKYIASVLSNGLNRLFNSNNTFDASYFKNHSLNNILGDIYTTTENSNASSKYIVSFVNHYYGSYSMFYPAVFNTSKYSDLAFDNNAFTNKYYTNKPWRDDAQTATKLKELFQINEGMSLSTTTYNKINYTLNHLVDINNISSVINETWINNTINNLDFRIKDNFRDNYNNSYYFRNNHNVQINFLKEVMKIFKANNYNVFRITQDKDALVNILNAMPHQFSNFKIKDKNSVYEDIKRFNHHYWYTNKFDNSSSQPKLNSTLTLSYNHLSFNGNVLKPYFNKAAYKKVENVNGALLTNINPNAYNIQNEFKMPKTIIANYNYFVEQLRDQMRFKWQYDEWLISKNAHPDSFVYNEQTRQNIKNFIKNNLSLINDNNNVNDFIRALREKVLNKQTTKQITERKEKTVSFNIQLVDDTTYDNNGYWNRRFANTRYSSEISNVEAKLNDLRINKNQIISGYHNYTRSVNVVFDHGGDTTSTTEYYDVIRPYTIRYNANETKTITVYDKDEYIKQNINLLTLIWYFDTYFIEDFAVNKYLDVENNLLNNVDLLLDPLKMKEVIKKYNMDSNYNFAHRHNPYQAFLGKDNKFYFINQYYTYNPSNNKPNTISNFNSIDELAEKIDYEKNINIYTLNNNNILNEENDLNSLIKEINKLASNNDAKINPLRFFSDLDNKLNSYNVVKPYAKNISKNNNQTINSFVERIKEDYFDHLSNPRSKYNQTNIKQTYTIANNLDANGFIKSLENNKNPVLHLPDGEYFIKVDTTGNNLEINLIKLKDINLVNGVIVNDNFKKDIEHIKNMIANEANVKDTLKVEYQNNGEIQSVIQSQEYLKDNIIEFDAIINDFLLHYDDNDYIVKIVNDDIDYKPGKESQDKPFKDLNYKFNEVVFKSVKNYINNIKARFDDINVNNNYYRYHILMLYMKKIFAVDNSKSLLSDYQVFSKWNMYFNNILMNYAKLDDLETKNLTFNWNEKVLDTIKGIINKENIEYNNKIINNNLIKVYLSHYFNIANHKNNLDNEKFSEYKYNNLKEWIIKNYNENQESEYRNFNINSEAFQYDYETLHNADKYVLEDYGNLFEKKYGTAFSITINGTPYAFYEHQSDLNKLWNQNNEGNLVKENEIVLLLNDEIKFDSNNRNMDYISNYVNEIIFNNYKYEDLHRGENDIHERVINKNNINQKLFKRPIYKRQKTLIKIKRDKIVKQNKVLQFIYRSNKYGDILLNITWDENNNYSLWIGDIKVNNASDIALNDIKALENYFAPFIKTDTGTKKVSLNDYSINMNFNKINDNNNLIAYDINANIQLNNDKNKQVYENVLFNLDNENNHYVSNNVKLRYNEYIWREDPQEKIINFENIKTINIDEINEFFRNNFETNNFNTNDYNLAVFVNNVGIYNSINDRLFDIINLVFDINEINRTKRLSFKDYAAAFNLDELNHNINEYLNLINNNNDIIATLTKRNLKIYQRMLIALDKLLSRQVINNNVIQDFKDFETLKDLNSKFAISEVIKKVISDLSYTMNNIYLIEERFNQRYSLSAYNEFRQLSNLNQIKEEYKHLKTLTFNGENNNNVLETIKYNFEYTKLKELKKYPNFNLDLLSYHISYSNSNAETSALIEFYNQIINEDYLKLAFNDKENKYKATRILNSIFYQLYTLITNQTLEHSYNINDEKLKNLAFLNESLKLVKNYEYQYHNNASRSGYGSFLITPKSTYEMYSPYMSNNSINGNSRVVGSSEYDFILKNNTGNRIYNTINKKTSDKYYSSNETATPYDNRLSNNLITNKIDAANDSLLKSNFKYHTDTTINDVVKIETVDKLKEKLEQLIEIPDTTFKFYLFNDIENRKTLFATMSLIIQYHKNKYQINTLSAEMKDTINKLNNDITNMINKYNNLNNINENVLKQTSGLNTYLNGNYFTKNQNAEFNYQNTNYEVISISPYNEYTSKTLLTFNYLLNNFKTQMKQLNANYAQLFNIYTIFNIFIEKVINEMSLFSNSGLYLLADKDEVAANQIEQLQKMRKAATQNNNLLSYILSNNLAYNENPFSNAKKGTRTIFSILSPVYYGISIYDTITQSRQINQMITDLKQTLNQNMDLINKLPTGTVKDYLSNEIFNVSNLKKQVDSLDASNTTADYILGYALNVALNNPIVLLFVGDTASRNVLHNLVRYDMTIINNEIKYTYDYYNLKSGLSYNKVKVVIKDKNSDAYKEVIINLGGYHFIPSDKVYNNIIFNLPYINRARLWGQSNWLNENDKNNYIKQINIYERFNLRNGYELNGDNLLPLRQNDNIKIDNNSGLKLYKFK